MENFEWLDTFLHSLPGCTQDFKAEWGWQRYMVGGKMFAALCRPGAEHGEYADHPLLTVKCEPGEAELQRAAYPGVHPGFYMNKQHWNSLLLDADLPRDFVQAAAQNSYRLVLAGLPKRLQRELAGE